MHIHLPKPLHGWRAFVGEVGIIVIGVLIALSAEQVIETVHAHQRIRETRAALDAELSRDLAAFEWRASHRSCVRPRVAELDRWAKAMAAGKVIKLKKEITPPIFFAINTTVWQASENDAGQMQWRLSSHMRGCTLRSDRSTKSCATSATRGTQCRDMRTTRI